jgi:RimJ/RimL family protein N-acetyltransferase
MTYPIVNPYKDVEYKLCFETYSKDYLIKSWEWLNDSEIHCLTNTPSFSKDEQIVWYRSLKHRRDYLVWGISVNKIKIGVVGLKHITDISAEFFTYIGAKEYWGKGFGKQIMSFAQQYAYDMLHLRELTLKVLHNNIRAIGLYKYSGFVVDKEDEIYIYMKKEMD